MLFAGHELASGSSEQRTQAGDLFWFRDPAEGSGIRSLCQAAGKTRAGMLRSRKVLE